MDKTKITPRTRPAGKLSTEHAAERLAVRPQTLVAGLCRSGHYLGLRPIKLPNGRLLWDATEIARLTCSEVSK